VTLAEAILAAKHYLWRRQGDYRSTFRAPTARTVLEDLARFCYAHESTFHPDPRIHAAREGKREVWLRITQHLNLTPDELWLLFDGREPPRQS
jgi:hypothetical protein